MATVTFTVKDEEEGQVNIAFEFDPPLSDEIEETAAHRLAGIAFTAMTDAASGAKSGGCCGDGDCSCRS